MEKLISFIIPYYNQGIYIHETISSVLNSTYQNFEVIIINDGSDEINTTQLLSIIDNFSDNRIKVYHQENKGPSVARNFGIKLALGEYIVFLDGDDLIEKDTLEICINEMNKNIDVIYGNNLLFGEKEILIKPNQNSLKNILIFNPIAVCVMVKKEIVLINPFDEYLSKLGLEIWELWLNLISKGYNFKYINKNLFRIRVLKNSRTTNEANINLENIKSYVFQKHSNYLAQEYYKLFYLQKQTLETPDYKIGNLFLKPYRLLKKLFD